MDTSNSDISVAALTKNIISDYLDIDALFYPINNAEFVSITEFTIGVWLECAWRLRAEPTNADQRNTFRAATVAVEQARSRSPQRYEDKAQREFKSRLDSLSWYLDGHPTSPGFYVSQAHTRLKLELLKHDVPQHETELQRLQGLDDRLKSILEIGPFLADEVLEPQATKEEMWWLFRTIGSRK